MDSSDGAQVRHSLYFPFQNDPFIVIVKISKWIHQTHKSQGSLFNVFQFIKRFQHMHKSEI